MRYEPDWYIPEPKQNKQGAKNKGKWQVIAGEMSPGMFVPVANASEAKCLFRACQNRGLKVKTRMKPGEPFGVEVK